MIVNFDYLFLVIFGIILTVWGINMKYDFIIVGAGPSGIFAAYELLKQKDQLKILMIEKGRSIDERFCPKRRSDRCACCSPCNITTGFSGAGAFSDGKLSLNEHGEIGGNLGEYLKQDEFVKILNYTDQIYLDLGADDKIYGQENTAEILEIKRKAIRCNLKLIESGVRHLGTEKAFAIYQKLQKKLEQQGVEFLFNTEVTDLIIANDKIKGIVAGQLYEAKRVVIAVGREGCSWFDEICNKYQINRKSGIIDIGVRIECDSNITKIIDEANYESKLINYTNTFDDKVRTFCWNPRGEVTEERYENNLALVNGHSYKDEKLKTNNTNLALLVSKNFTEPFKSPVEYGKHIARLANMLSDGKVIVQTYGDFKRGRRTTPSRLKRNNTQPTLKDAVPGDLSLVFPYRLMLDIKETIESLDKLMAGFAGDGTLLYGVEVKFYSNRLILDDNFQTNIGNLYALGDGAGITRGLMQASMNGIAFARKMKKNIN